MRTTRHAMEHTPIAHVLTRKTRRTVVTVTPECSLQDAAMRMYENAVGCLLVVEGARVLGIVTERDCTRCLAWGSPAGCGAEPVRRLMSVRVVVVVSTYTVAQCLAIMCDRRIRHLPVIEDVAVVGLVSRGDLVRFLLQGARDAIENLPDYILDVQPGLPLARQPLRRVSSSMEPRCEPGARRPPGWFPQTKQPALR